MSGKIYFDIAPFGGYPALRCASLRCGRDDEGVGGDVRFRPKADIARSCYRRCLRLIGDRMPELVFEIWGKGPDADAGDMYLVHPQNDKVRAAVTPNAVLIHRFTAKSAFEAFRHKNEWFGYSPWEPPEGLEDQCFSEAEASEQRGYLSRRTV